MKKHTCLECGIEGYSPDGEIPHGWVDRSFHTRAPLQERRERRVVACSLDCFHDALNECESYGSEVLL